VSGEPIPLTPPAEERLSSLTMPILAVVGGLDSSEMTDTARHLETAAPDARALIWDDVAHMIGMEQPERLADLIVGFLTPLPRWS
jgi:pimeloyl-ACP methyl ester carboxylesterase